MLDHATDGFNTTLHALPYVVGGATALALVTVVFTALVLLIDTAIGTSQNITRTRRLHRDWTRSGRTPSR